MEFQFERRGGEGRRVKNVIVNEAIELALAGENYVFSARSVRLLSGRLVAVELAVFSCTVFLIWKWWLNPGVVDSWGVGVW